MKKYAYTIGLMIFMAVFIVFFGCTGKSAPTNFYLMDTQTQTTNQTIDQNKPEVIVGIGPVTIAAYLDRPQIVTRKGKNRLALAEFDNWAEPLEDTVSRIVLDSLTARLYSEVALFPWQSPVDMDFQVTVDVNRLDNIPSGQALLVVRWTLWKGHKQLILTRLSSYTSPWDPDPLNLDAFATAHSKNLESLCTDIAAAIKNKIAAK
jgi:uncharacterized lipoprotein YmbA